MTKPPRYAAHIGRTLRSIRLHRGFTQCQIADALGVHRPAVTLIECGARPATVDELIALARFYRTSLDEVLLSRISTQPPFS